jgi:hypothetical protein
MCDGELKQPHHDKQCAKVVQTLALQNSDHLCLSHTKAKTGKNYYLYVFAVTLLGKPWQLLSTLSCLF